MLAHPGLSGWFGLPQAHARASEQFEPQVAPGRARAGSGLVGRRHVGSNERR
jgi:hypothetical protein